MKNKTEARVDIPGGPTCLQLTIWDESKQYSKTKLPPITEDFEKGFSHHAVEMAHGQGAFFGYDLAKQNADQREAELIAIIKDFMRVSEITNSCLLPGNIHDIALQTNSEKLKALGIT